MIINIKKFKNSFISIRDNYVLEIKTGKTYVANYLDDSNEILLLEPNEFEEKLEKIEKKVSKKFGNILSEIV